MIARLSRSVSTMGLLRLTTIVAVGVALLPSDREKQDQLYARAASATTWAATFCDRNPATCEQANATWQTFVAKAEFGARLAYDMARDRETPAVEPAAYTRDGGTLTGSDLRPAWRGKTASKKGI